MKPFYPAVAGACLLLLPLSAYADLGPIVITPTRTEQPSNTSSATVYVVNEEDIKNSGAVNTSELLRSIPGMQVEDLFGNGNDVTVSVRGFSATANANTLVLVNGRRLNYSDTAAPDIQQIFPQDIERIEVLVGSAGSLYGDQAVGGVVNIITKRPEMNFHHIRARTGSFAYRDIEFNSSRQVTKSIGYRLSAGSVSADHYRDNNEQDRSNFSGIVEYAHNANQFFVELQDIDDNQELPGALLEDEFEDDPTQINPGFENDFRDEDTRVYRLGYQRDLGAHRFSIDTTTRETDADVRQSFRNNPSPADGFIDRRNESINPKLSGVISNGIEMPYVIGIDAERTDFDLEIPNTFFTTESNSEQQIDSIYFQVLPRLGEQLQLTLGMRNSKLENELNYFDALSTETETDVDDDITVMELGLAYDVDAQTRLTVRFDENFRFAKIDEFQQTLAPTVLETQTGESIEVGLNLTRDNQQLTLSIYRLDLEDEIEFDPTLGPDFGFGPIGLNTNLDRTRREGLTLSWLSQLSAELSLKLDVGVVDAKFESGVFEGNDISGVASEIAILRFDYRASDFFGGYVTVDYTGPMYAQGDNANQSDKIDSVTVINAGISYQYRSWDLDFRVNNLADKVYADFITDFGFGATYQPSPERNFMFSAGYGFE